MASKKNHGDSTAKPKRSHSVPMGGKRNLGPVTVLQVADLASCKTLDERANKMCENRYEIFLHNVEYLRKRHNLTQEKLCSEKLCSRISTQKMTGFKNHGKDIPLNAIITVASAFDLTLEEICGQLLDKKPQLSEGPAFTLDRPIDEYEKYTGLYDLVYFDPSKPLGNNPNPAADALYSGVLSIYAVYSAAGSVEFRATALLGCTAEERKKVAGMLEGVNLRRDGSQVYAHYESVAKTSDFYRDDGSRMKCLYSGKLTLSQEMIDITLHQITGGDVVHLLAHNRAATSSTQKEYKGGLAAMLSVSHGTEHMPCIQTISLLKGAYIETFDDQDQPIRTPKNTFEYFTKEQIAQLLYLGAPNIELKQEVHTIVSFMKFLYTEKTESSTLGTLSDEDKIFCLETFIEKKLVDTIKRNVLSYYKITKEMDASLYQMIRQNRSIKQRRGSSE